MYEILEQSAGNILGVGIRGKIDLAAERALIAKAEGILAEHGKIRVLVDVSGYEGISLKAFLVDIKWVATHLKQLEKLAVIGDSKALSWLVTQDARFAKHMGIAEKPFSTEERDEAWAWIAAD